MKPRTALLTACTAFMLWIAGALSASSATRHVVLLFGERPELAGLALLQADLVRSLTSNSADRIEVYNETMDLSRSTRIIINCFCVTSLKQNMRTKRSMRPLQSCHPHSTSC